MPRSAEIAPDSGLRVHGIACERGGKTLFGPIDLAVDAGAALFVLGPNGCGKSTLLRALAGLLEPLSGLGYWEGAAVRFGSAQWRRQAVYLGHKLGHKEELSVEENLTLAARLEGATVSSQACKAALARVGLESRQALLVKGLSQGQKQRLALARLCLSERRLWLLDEPSAALDTDAKGVLTQVLNEHLGKLGIAVVATHDSIELAADRVKTLRLA